MIGRFRDVETWRTAFAVLVATAVVYALWAHHRLPGINAPVVATTQDRSYLAAKTFDHAALLGDDRLELASGVTLHGGAAPVRARWAVQLPAPETFALDGDRVYVADEFLDAFRVKDGKLLWNTGNPDGETGLEADGGVRIGLDGASTVRAIAPSNYDISVDRRTGRLKAYGYTGDRSVTRFRAFPEPTSDEADLSDDYKTMKVMTRGGEVAWSITVDQPMFGPASTITVPGGVLVMTTSGLLVSLQA